MEKIVLSGIGFVNKGAELMLYAILQEIENKFPNSVVYLSEAIPQGYDFSTKLSFKTQYPIWLKTFKIQGIMERLKLPFYDNFIANKIVKDAKYFIDASGFLFSDQFNLKRENYQYWFKQLAKYKEQGTKIIFLPQAFGPIENKYTKDIIDVICEKADLIFAREKVSLDYLKQIKQTKDNVLMYPDFTSLIDGIIPSKYSYLSNGICIIPNAKMVSQGIVTIEEYINILTQIINQTTSTKHKTYLLNHEGIGDEDIIAKCKQYLGKDIEIVTGLNALEVKGMISSSYLCVSSRFHGVASALNSGVPCLATSWSHKYEELFKLYQQTDCILNTKDLNSIKNKITEYIDERNNLFIRQAITKILPTIKTQSKEMWDLIWSI